MTIDLKTNLKKGGLQNKSHDYFALFDFSASKIEKGKKETSSVFEKPIVNHVNGSGKFYYAEVSDILFEPISYYNESQKNINALTSEFFLDWHKSPSREISISTHQKIFKKLIKLFKDIQSDAEPINEFCEQVSTYVGSVLASLDLLPTRLVKSEEGSIAFEFKSNDNSASIEIFNDGEIVFLHKKQGRLSADNLEVSQIAEYLSSLK
jgi:hypothetical protein